MAYVSSSNYARLHGILLYEEDGLNAQKRNVALHSNIDCPAYNKPYVDWEIDESKYTSIQDYNDDSHNLDVLKLWINYANEPSEQKLDFLKKAYPDGNEVEVVREKNPFLYKSQIKKLMEIPGVTDVYHFHKCKTCAKIDGDDGDTQHDMW